MSLKIKFERPVFFSALRVRGWGDEVGLPTLFSLLEERISKRDGNSGKKLIH